jgi:hypothetical protein
LLLLSALFVCQGYSDDILHGAGEEDGVCGGESMIITQELLDDLTRRAQNSPRLRMNLDLRNSEEDGSQRLMEYGHRQQDFKRFVSSSQGFATAADEL